MKTRDVVNRPGLFFGNFMCTLYKESKYLHSTHQCSDIRIQTLLSVLLKYHYHSKKNRRGGVLSCYFLFFKSN